MLIAFYGFYAAPQWSRYRYTTWDALRDAINARHLLEGGNFLADPAFEGFPSWYPPTHAAILAAFSKFFNADLIQTYAISAVVFNGLAIAAFYVLAYRFSGGNPHAAFLATLSLSALPWFVTYVLLSPTVLAHATVLSLIFLAFYAFNLENESPKITALFGVSAGLMGLFHPPTFIILTGALSLHGCLRIQLDSFRRKTISHVGWLLLITLLVSSPYWISTLLHPMKNTEPIRYIAPPLYHLEFVLPGKSVWRSIPLLLPALWGIVLTYKRKRDPLYGFLLSLFLVSLAGQVPVYYLAFLKAYQPDVYLSLSEFIPILTPHEFQMYSQLCAGLFFAVGLSGILSLKRRALRWSLSSLVILAVCASLSACLIEIPKHSKLFLWPYREQSEWKGAVQYIRDNTNVHETICTPNDSTSFFVVGVQTGRKCLSTFPSHANTRADIESRQMTRDEILYRADQREILQAAEEYSIQYLLCSRKINNPQRLLRFREWFPVLYDDEIVSIFRVTPKKPEN
ncbi:MAG: ArnT family glycosyltransferase [Candidatus Hinthialibacter sp.]